MIYPSERAADRLGSEPPPDYFHRSVSGDPVWQLELAAFEFGRLVEQPASEINPTDLRAAIARLQHARRYLREIVLTFSKQEAK
jgi:hypothetical protein